MTSSTYCGRFAPSPTGPLHFGSLVTALASYLEARSRNGLWLVRIEDLDPLRESPEATRQILYSLEQHQLIWDREVRFQSERLSHYRLLADQLIADGRAYRCGCSRKELKALAGRHPYRCRQGGEAPADRPRAIRFALENETAAWEDGILGPQTQTIVAEVDDPVIIRKEGFVAYQLAVVADDIDQGVTDIVRGSDLLDTTGQQRQLFHALTPESPPGWSHIPVVVNQQGQKLSKQNLAPALNDQQPGLNLWQALHALGQQPPQSLHKEPAAGVLDWARRHWDRARIPRHSTSAP